MKKFCISFLFITIIILAALFSGCDLTEKEYLRIHIRANSNSETDQTVKLKVRDEIVGFLTPYLSNVKKKEDAKKFLKENISAIEKIADKVLFESGFSYSSKANLRSEEFPLRVYGDLTLEQGIYDALIIELGEGKGDNWWCVVYPPLCFVSASGGYVYRSKIFSIINDIFN